MAAVIELDVLEPWPPPDSGPRAGRPPVVAAVVVVVGVLVALTGPALLLPDSLTLAWRSATEHFWAANGVAYTLDPADDGVRLTARNLRTGAPRWAVPLTGALAQVYARGETFMSSNFPPDATTGVRTNVVASRGGLPRLAFPSAALAMAYIGSRVALIIDRDPTVPADPTADGRTRAMGLEWTHVATAVDLGTGQTRWRRTLPAGVRWALPGVRAGAEGIVGLPPGQDWFVTSSTGGDVQVRDVDTGALLARRQFGPLRQQAYVTALVDSVLVRLTDGDGATLDAYDQATLTPRWRFLPPIIDAEPVDCAPLLCLADNLSIWVVDPNDGATLWRPTGPLLRPGPTGRVLIIGYGNQLGVFDTWRAARLRPDTGWRAVDAAAYTRMVVVVREPTADLTADLGLLDVASGVVRRLGWVSRWSAVTRCMHADGHIACGDGEQVRIWRA